MEEPSLQDSREELLYTTTTTDVFEYAPYEVEKGVKAAHSRKLYEEISSSLKSTYKFLVLSVTTFLFVSLDFLKFICAYIWYIRLKLISLVVFLEASKDKVVRALMWRRGLLFRPATHGGVVALVAIAVIAGGLFSKSDIAAQDLTMMDSALTANNTPVTIIPTDRPRAEVIKYEVGKGDTLSEIAEEFGVSVNSIRWVNGLSSTDKIKPADTLNIPPVSGVVHTVKKGQTIHSIAKKYEANPQAIANFPFNYIDETLSLTIGQNLVVPGGIKSEPVVVPVPGYAPSNPPPINYAAAGNGLFARPLPGPINQYPSWYHPGIDIGASYGAGVYAAGSGRVITASQYGPGFGMHIFVDHGNGYITAYAHLSSMKVNVGRNISKGQLIGSVGCSGLCTGPHLHFEVRRNGARINPLSVL